MTARPDRVVVFDLDDTLYLERDYVVSGFAAVGERAKRRYRIDGLSKTAQAAFEAGHRGTIFDVALASLGIAPSPELIADLVQAYRRHRPRIQMAADASDWLAARSNSTAVALVTDGDAHSQTNKIAALGLAGLGFAPIVVTARLGKGYGKPHPRAFELVAGSFDLPADRFTYVADNCAKDFVAPRQLGWDTVRIARPGGLHCQPPPSPAHEAAAVMRSLSDLPTGSTR